MDGLKLTKNTRFRCFFISSDRFPLFRVDVAVLFAKKLAGRGHGIDFLLQSEDECDEPYQATWSGCRVFVGRTDNGTTTPCRVRKNLKRIWHELSLVRFVGRGRYDFILCKDLFFSAVFGLLAAKATGTKLIYWLSYPFPEASLFEVAQGVARYPFIYRVRGHIIGFILYRLILPFTDHIFVQSSQMCKDITSKGISEKRMTPVPMGLEMEEIPFFGYEDQQVGAGSEKIILYLGTLMKVRRIDFLVRVLCRVLAKEKRARLFLVGAGEDPSDEEVILDEARRLGIQGEVLMTGFLPRDKAWELVGRAHVCVSPFYPTPILNSTSPTKLIEYMGMGKVVVANDHPEQKLVLQESGGGLCVPYEENAFSEAILYLFEHPQEAKEMGVRGRAYVERNRDYEIIADQVERRIEEVLGR